VAADEDAFAERRDDALVLEEDETPAVKRSRPVELFRVLDAVSNVER
jgi:hypothetical protein